MRPGYGVWARLAWYWRRLCGLPATRTYQHPDGWWWTVIADPKPPLRREPDWSGWQEIGTTAEPGG